MNTLGWIVSLLIVGMLAGAGVGALLTFTGARSLRDLAVGQLGALAAAGLVYFTISPAARGLLPILIAGVGGAILATWLTRVATWAPEPKLVAVVSDLEPHRRLPPGAMTTGEASRLWITEGRLVAADPRS